jgi:signal transduction histidine kinase
MSQTDSYRELEKGFLSTFLGELLPGVLHNFANPLNGIMGRSKLLQRRLADNLKKMEQLHPGFAAEFGEEKISRDVNSIASEAERFFEIFRDLAGKVSTLSSPEPERIDLSKLVLAEIRFADFYLDFKHDIKKSITLGENLPGILGNAAAYSLCLSAVINSARERLKPCSERELSVSASHGEGVVRIVIQDNGNALGGAVRRVADGSGSSLDSEDIPDHDRLICHAILLLKQSGVSVVIDSGNGCNRISLAIPIDKAHP